MEMQGLQGLRVQPRSPLWIAGALKLPVMMSMGGGGGVGTATRFKWAALTTLTTKQAETGGEALPRAPKALAAKAEQEPRFVLVVVDEVVMLHSFLYLRTSSSAHTHTIPHL